jgi:hypothetical protein
MSRLSRFIRFAVVAGAVPVGVTYQTCAYTNHGFSVLPDIGVSLGL